MGLKKTIFNFMYICVLLTMYHMCVPGALISREGAGSPKTGVIDGCELLYGC